MGRFTRWTRAYPRSFKWGVYYRCALPGMALGLSTADMYWDGHPAVVLPPDQNGVVYHLKIGDDQIYQLDSGGTDKVIQAMSAAPLNKDGYVYLPARFIAGLLG